MVGNIKRRLSSQDAETGAEIIQFAFAIPLLIILGMSVIQICIMAFATLTLTGEVEQAAWAVDIENLQNATSVEEANRLVKDEIGASSFGLDADLLVVANAAFTSVGEYSPEPKATRIERNNILVNESEHSRYQLGEMYRETTSGLVEFDVSYELPTIINLPGLGHVRVTRHVARERIASTRTEIR